MWPIVLVPTGSIEKGGRGGTAYKMTMLHYGGTSREKQNWVKGEEMLLFNAIFANKYIKGHILESRFTC